MPWRRLVALAVLLGLVGFFLFTRPGRAAFTAALLVLEVLPDVPLRPLTTFSSPPERQEVSFPFGQTLGKGDLYRPAASGRHSAVVMFLGVGPDVENPDLHRVAQGLARAGVASLMVKPNGISLERLSLEQVELVRSAFEFLEGQPFVEPGRVGLVGYCTGASIVLLAAAEEGLRGRVALVHALAPYFDAEEWVGAMLSGSASDGVEGWVPDEATVHRVRQHLIEATEPSDQEAIQAALEEGGAEPEGLSEGGWAVYRLLRAQSAAPVAARLEELPPGIKEGLWKLSPRRVVDRLEAKVYLIHDRSDPVIPVGESRRLAAALPPEVLGRYTESSLFEHAHATRPLSWFSFLGEIWKLLTHLQAVLEALL